MIHLQFGAVLKSSATLPIPASTSVGNREEATVDIYQLDDRDKKLFEVIDNAIHTENDRTSFTTNNATNWLHEHPGSSNSWMYFKNLKSTAQKALGLLKYERENPDKTRKPAVVYVAVADRKPVGLLVGSMPRRIEGEDEYVYSMQGKKDETELNWLMAMAPKGFPKGLPGTGTALLTQFYLWCATMGFKNIYVRSELPDMAKAAVPFYESMQFKEIKKDIIPDNLRDFATDTVIDAKKQDDIVPMQLPIAEAKTTAYQNQFGLLFRAPEKHRQHYRPIEKVIDFPQFVLGLPVDLEKHSLKSSSRT